MDVMCQTTVHRHATEPRCEGCGSTDRVSVTRPRGGAAYAVCGRCWERGRKGWYRPDRGARA